MQVARRKHHKKRTLGKRWKPSARSMKKVKRAGLMAGSAMSLAMAFGGSAQAFEFTVYNTADGGEGSLREAIDQANNNPDPDTIVFSSLFDSPRTIYLTSGSLLINDDVTIEGPGSELLTIDGAEQTDRIFEIDGPEGVGIGVEISGMTITGGRTPDQDNFPAGGGIRSSYVSYVDLTLTDTVITGNAADSEPADGSEGFGYGGGVASLGGGSLTVSDSVVSGNTAGQDGDGVTLSAGIGGGILAVDADVLIEDSTISENKAINRRRTLLPIRRRRRESRRVRQPYHSRKHDLRERRR